MALSKTGCVSKGLIQLRGRFMPNPRARCLLSGCQIDPYSSKGFPIFFGLPGPRFDSSGG